MTTLASADKTGFAFERDSLCSDFRAHRKTRKSLVALMRIFGFAPPCQSSAPAAAAAAAETKATATPTATATDGGDGDGDGKGDGDGNGKGDGGGGGGVRCAVGGVGRNRD